MKVKFDGMILETEDVNDTIVTLADKYDIHIEAPCYRNKKKYGACAGCNVEVDGIDKYACVTKIEDGMVISYDREDLNQARNERLAKYYDLRAKGIVVKCGEASNEKKELTLGGKIKIDFDGQIMFTDNEEDNVVQIAEKNGVYIPAPCYRNKKGLGCCKGCNVEINGEVKAACHAKVEDGMRIIYDREDLVKNRKENLLIYSKMLKDKKSENTVSSNRCGCSCSCS